MFLNLERGTTFNRYTSPEQFYNSKLHHKPPANVYLSGNMPGESIYTEEQEVKLNYYKKTFLDWIGLLCLSRITISCVETSLKISTNDNALY